MTAPMTRPVAAVAVRVVVNVAIFSLFLGALGAFLMKSAPGRLAVDRAVVVIVAGGVWAGVLVTIGELRAASTASRLRRLLVAAVLGAATYLGLLVAVRAFDVVPVTPSALVVVAAFGALVHALRAARSGVARDEEDDDEEEDEDESGEQR